MSLWCGWRRSEFGEKYELMMVEEQLESDLEASDNSGPRGPRVSFVISPMALMEPEATTNWQASRPRFAVARNC